MPPEARFFSWARPVVLVGFGVPGAPEGSTGRLIFGDTFAACSNLIHRLSMSKFPEKRNQADILRYSANAHRLDRLGNNVRREIHCLEATYVKDILLNDPIFQLNFRVSGGISRQ